MDNKWSLCEHAFECYYGYNLNGRNGLCDYIGITGKSRVVNNPKGEIVNGICGEFKERRNGVRGKAGGTNGLCGRADEWYMSEVGESGIYGSAGPDSDPSGR